MTWASDDQRILIGLLAAAHDGDELGFAALLNGAPRGWLRMTIRSLVEAVVAGQLAAEEEPGAARECLAREALSLAAKDSHRAAAQLTVSQRPARPIRDRRPELGRP